MRELSKDNNQPNTINYA